MNARKRGPAIVADGVRTGVPPVAVGPGGVLRDGDAVVVGVGEMLCAVGGTLPPAWRGAA